MRKTEQRGVLATLISGIWLLQAVYYVPTGIWALVGIESFQKITGPKVDLWLVKTVGLLVSVVGGTIALAGSRDRITPEIRLVAIGTAAVLATIDIVYVLRGRIARIYLADALANAMIIVGWSLRGRTREQ